MIDGLFMSMDGGESIRSILHDPLKTKEPFHSCFVMRGMASPIQADFYFHRVMLGGESAIGFHPIQASLAKNDDAKQNMDLLVEERTAELYELNGFLSAIVDSSTETFIIAVSSNGTILSFNEGAYQQFQFSRNEVVGRLHVSQLFSEEERKADVWKEIEQTARAEGKCRKLSYLIRKTGKTFPALIDLTPLRNAAHQSLGMLFLGRDMTETLHTQLMLEEKKEQLEFINALSLKISQTLKLEEIAAISLEALHEKFSGVSGGIYLKNRQDEDLRLISDSNNRNNDLFIAFIPPSIEDYLLVEEGEVLIRDITREVASEFTNISDAPVTKLLLPLLPKATFIGVMVLLSKQRIHRTDELLSFLSALGATIGGALENAILYSDSLSKSIEIKKQNQELDEFAYVVSHDLKEPLAGISFISNLIVDDYYDKFDDTGKTYISSLIDFSKRLGSLIDALLDLSRIGRITQPPEMVHISEVLYDVQQNLSYRLASRDIELQLPKSSAVVFGDKTRIEQVFFNLLSNAIKFNDKNTVQVSVGFLEFSEDMYQFSIRDNGIGIEPVYFEKIFKIFERLNPREDYEGNGAGLTIVKKIIEHHGGQIWLDSELDCGTTFHFTLPKYKANQ